MIFLKCPGATIYSKVWEFNQKIFSFLDRNRVKHFNELSKYLENRSHVINSDSELIEHFLSKTQFNNMLYTFKDKKSVAVWNKFESIFVIYSDLLENKSVIKSLNEMLLGALLRDKVIGAEFRQKYDIGKPDGIMEYLRNMTYYEKRVPKDQVLHAATSNRTPHEHEEFHIKRFPTSFILPGRKNKKDNKLQKLIDGLRQAKKNNDEDTVGFDFFGYEDDPFTGARNFLPLSLRKFEQEAETGRIMNLEHVFNQPAVNQTKENLKEKKQNDFETMLDILRDGHKLYLHAGETSYFPDYPVDATFLQKFYINDNLIHSALLPNVMRLGHGFAAGSNDLLMNIYRRKNISLEICPVSNQALKYSKVSKNPLTRLLREGISVTISPDDPGLFFYSGVRMDWFNLIMQTDLLPSEYYILLRNSILKSSINEIKNNAQKFLDETKMQMEEFFNSENYRIMRQAFPNNKELENYLTLKNQKNVKIIDNNNIDIKEGNFQNFGKNFWENHDKTVKMIKNRGKTDFLRSNNPYLNIYNFKSIIEQNKSLKRKIQKSRQKIINMKFKNINA